MPGDVWLREVIESNLPSWLRPSPSYRRIGAGLMAARQILAYRLLI